MSTDIRPGIHLLGFRVERVLGRGGMGVVYLAHQLALDRMVALKLLAPELAEDEAYRERFLRESKLAAALDHPNIVPVFDAGEVDGRLYIAMRYVEGSDLRRVLDQEGSVAPEQAIALLAPVADALDTAHAKGLVHRDVKPSNILVDERERPYLADFGLTKQVTERGLVEQSHFAASLDYVAPEQIEGQPVGPSADSYSLACILHECLTGTPPFRRSSPLATLFAQVNDPPPATGEPIDAVLARGLAKEPGERYATCAELITAARDALGVPEAVVVRDRRPILLAAVGALLILAAALAAFFLTRDGGPAEPSTKPTLTPAVDSLQRIDPKTNELAATIGVGHNPNTVAVGAGSVWVGSLEDQSVLRIDPRTNEMTGRVSVDFPITVAVGHGQVHVAALNNLVRIDPVTLAISTVQSTRPILIWGVAAGESTLWTLGYELQRLNRAGDLVTTVRNVGAEPKAVAVGEEAVWVLDGPLRSVWRVNPRTNRVSARIRLGFDPGSIAAGGGAVWVTDNGGDSVAEIDPRTNRVSRSIAVGDGPIGVAVGLSSVWVANYRNGTVSRIDPRTGSVVATTSVGRYPAVIVAGESAVWVAVRA